MRLFLVVIFFFFKVVLIWGQEQKSETEFERIAIDHLGNTYYINDSKLIKQNPKKTISFENTFLGHIKSLDLSNPLRILIFYEESNNILFLNQELAIIGDIISLDELNVNSTIDACSSTQNGFWLINGFSKRLEFYNIDNKLTHSSEVIDNIESHTLESMCMYGNKVYINMTNRGILVFDNFATYIKTIPITKANSIQITSKGILYAKGTEVWFYEFDTLKQTLLWDNNSKINYLRNYNSKYYYLSNGNLEIRK
jgi:hypothetical protein